MRQDDILGSIPPRINIRGILETAMKKRVLVTGGSGLVGSRFVEFYSKKYDLVCPEYPAFDLTDIKNVNNHLSKSKPDVIVNFAAYTNVGEAENQRGDKKGDCYKINVEGVKNLLSATDPKVHFIHISTDMVFPGSKNDPGPYAEDHVPETNPDKLTWYGFTKAEGEREVLKVLGKEVPTILRLIYPVRAHYGLKLDYLRKPLSLFDEGKLYPMFSDQHVSIAFVDEIAKTLEKIIDGGERGIFHASSRDTTTPYELVFYMIEKVRGKKSVVKSASLKEFLKTVDNPVRYPEFGGLAVENTEKRLAMKFSTWKEIVDALISQGLGK